MHENDMGGIGKLSRKRLSEVIRHCKDCIKATDVSDCLKISRAKARNLLSIWSKHGWLQRIRPGLYLAVELASESSDDILIDPWVIAMQLYSPCYLGGWSACQHWDLTEQIFDKTLVLTSKRINGKKQIAGNMHFLIKKTDSTKFFGFKTIWKESVKVQISDLHKTIVDILDDPALAGGIRSVADMLQKYLKSEDFNSSLLVEYALNMHNKTIFKRLGFLLSMLKFEDTVLIEQCRQNISQGNSQIDPSSKGKRLVKKWGLWLPNGFENTFLMRKNS